MSLIARTALAAFLGTFLLAPLGHFLLRAGEVAALPDVAELLRRVEVQDLLANSILLGLAATLLALLLGVPLGVLLGRRRFVVPGTSIPLDRALLVLLLVPLLIPPHIHTIGWARILGDRGWFTRWLAGHGVPLVIRAPLADPQGSPFLGHIYPGPAWIIACATFPVVALLVRAGLLGLDRTALEALVLAPAGRIARARMLLAMIAPRLSAGAILAFILALSAYPVVSLLDTPVLIQKVFFTFSQVDPGAGLLLALPLFAMALLLLVFVRLFDRRFAGESRGVAEPERPRAGAGAVLLLLLVLAITLALPLGSLLAEAGPLRGGGGAPDHYRSVVARVLPAFGDSFAVTGATLVATMLLAVPLGRALARRRKSGVEILGLAVLVIPAAVLAAALLAYVTDASVRWASPLLAPAGAAAVLLLLPGGRARLRVPALLGAAALAVLLVHPKLGLLRVLQEGGMGLSVIGLSVLAFPVATRIVRGGVAALDPASVDAARFGHAGPWVRWWRVERPAIGRSLLVAGLFTYVFAFTELPATLLLARPRWQSVQIRIFNMVHYQSIGEVSALCLLVVLAAMLPIVLAALLLPARRRT
jgi:ABC-type Fe3+ transport system permease subunit